jgi:membrane associated rhomboid family serine protease
MFRRSDTAESAMKIFSSAKHTLGFWAVCALGLAAGTYYVSNNVWFQPACGANGAYYRVVPKP